jgi:DNA repair exonuclease SbcCD ATPase subunit
MINFKKLRYQNLLSTGNQFTELDLQRSSSTLIVGENGAGKSTFIEALTFALYGKPYRNINKPQLLNSITGKNLVVELEFSVGKKEYMIRRGMKPNLFEIYQNGEMLNQNAGSRDDQEYLEKNILKLNFKSFSQIVVLGSANYVPFMQLPAMQRRSVVEDLLDIQIFSVMNSILRDKLNTNREELQSIDHKISLCEQKIDMHSKHIDTLKSNNDELIQQKRAKIDEHDKAIEQYKIAVEGLMSQVEELNTQVSDQNKIENRKNKLVQMEASLEDRIRKLNKEIQFFHDHDNCPTCKQGIDHDFKTTTVEVRSTKKVEVEEALEKLETEIKTTQDRLNFINTTNTQIQHFNTAIQSNNQQITFYQRYITDLNKEIDALIEQGNKIHTDMDDTEQYEQELAGNKKQKELLSRQKAVYDVAAHLLKDTGIKTKIIKQYVPIMNKLINKYLAAMDFFVDFQLDESFNETIKSRFRDDFSYASFSEGEKMRIDLALMFTWRAIAKLRNSASTNLLIMDEVFDSSLDASGTEEFLKILETLTQDTNTFIISHKGDQLFDRFHSIIKFEKHSNFSRIAA